MTDDANPLASLGQSEIEDLARRALTALARSRARSQKQRDTKKAAGLVPITVWVPESRAAYIRHIIDRALTMDDSEFQRHAARALASGFATDTATP